MGNKYGIMVKVMLTCRLFKDVEENSKEFPVVVHTTDYIDDLKEKIYEKVKNNDFLEIEDYDDLKLWKVEIDNNNDEAFSNLILKNDKTKNVTKLLGSIGEYWDDEKRRPKEGCTHVIVDSPRLVESREKDRQIQDKEDEISVLREEFERLMTKGGPNILKDEYDTGKIKKGDEVKYGKDHICLLSVIGSIPFITYRETKYYSIYSFLKCYLQDIYPDRDPKQDPYQSERRPFSIGGIGYNAL